MSQDKTEWKKESNLVIPIKQVGVSKYFSTPCLSETRRFNESNSIPICSRIDSDKFLLMTDGTASFTLTILSELATNEWSENGQSSTIVCS